MRYRVTSGRVAGHKPGDIYKPEPGVNVRALERAGHIAAEPKKAAKKKKGGD